MFLLLQPMEKLPVPCLNAGIVESTCHAAFSGVREMLEVVGELLRPFLEPKVQSAI